VAWTSVIADCRATPDAGEISLRVLITVGAALIGGQLADAYVNSGDDLDLLADTSTGSIHDIGHLEALELWRS